MNPLNDILPSTARKVLYAAVFLGLLVYSAFQASNGDWTQMVGALLTSLAPLLAASNVTPMVEPEDIYLDEDDYAGEGESDTLPTEPDVVDDAVDEALALWAAQPDSWPGVPEGRERGTGSLPGPEAGS